MLVHKQDFLTHPPGPPQNGPIPTTLPSFFEQMKSEQKQSHQQCPNVLAQALPLCTGVWGLYSVLTLLFTFSCMLARFLAPRSLTNQVTAQQIALTTGARQDKPGVARDGSSQPQFWFSGAITKLSQKPTQACNSSAWMVPVHSIVMENPSIPRCLKTTAVTFYSMSSMSQAVCTTVQFGHNPAIYVSSHSSAKWISEKFTVPCPKSHSQQVSCWCCSLPISHGIFSYYWDLSVLI